MARPRSLVPALAILVSCGPAPADPLDDAPPVLANYADLLHAGYDDSVATATQLRTDLEPLLAATATDADLTTARASWRAARVPYMQTEFGRFYDGPIDDPAMGNLESLINAWPMDEATIDYVQGAPGMTLEGGIINMPTEFPSITADLLAQQNMMPGEENITVGYHAVEFLLWGQDFSDDGPGERPFTDYVMGTGTNVERRVEYLDVTSQLLVDHLEAVRDQWATGDDANYRATFLALPRRDAIHMILLGMARLAGGELAGQRIHTAYLTKDQEDEHSCFSDNTAADLAGDVQGLSNFYYGTYVRTDGTTVSGPSLSDMVRSRDAAVDQQARTAIDRALADIRAWPSAASCPSTALQGACPFDQLITGTDTAPGRMAIQAVYLDLHAVTDAIQAVAATLGTPLTPADTSED
jgi:putative iron-regulated protein